MKRCVVGIASALSLMPCVAAFAMYFVTDPRFWAHSGLEWNNGSNYLALLEWRREGLSLTSDVNVRWALERNDPLFLRPGFRLNAWGWIWDGDDNPVYDRRWERSGFGFASARSPRPYHDRSGRIESVREIQIAAPYWAIGTIFAILPGKWLASAILSRRRSSQIEKLACVRCGYDLRATPERCPECGAAPEPIRQFQTDLRPESVR